MNILRTAATGLIFLSSCAAQAREGQVDRILDPRLDLGVFRAAISSFRAESLEDKDRVCQSLGYAFSAEQEKWVMERGHIQYVKPPTDTDVKIERINLERPETSEFAKISHDYYLNIWTEIYCESPEHSAPLASRFQGVQISKPSLPIAGGSAYFHGYTAQYPMTLFLTAESCGYARQLQSLLKSERRPPDVAVDTQVTACETIADPSGVCMKLGYRSALKAPWLWKSESLSVRPHHPVTTLLVNEGQTLRTTSNPSYFSQVACIRNSGPSVDLPVRLERLESQLIQISEQTTAVPRAFLAKVGKTLEGQASTEVLEQAQARLFVLSALKPFMISPRQSEWMQRTVAPSWKDAIARHAVPMGYRGVKDFPTNPRLVHLAIGVLGAGIQAVKDSFGDVTMQAALRDFDVALGRAAAKNSGLSVDEASVAAALAVLDGNPALLQAIQSAPRISAIADVIGPMIEFLRKTQPH